MEEIAFSIKKWSAISSGIESDEAWNLWYKKGGVWPEGKTIPKATLIPPMMRRRMSRLSKVAVQAALQISENQQVDYIIFTSQHGELARTVTLLKDIVKGEDASPMAFSQSVHNTAAGLFTIASKRAIPVTSLASGENGLSSAIIEAYCYLSEHPENKVLVVDFDEPLPELYQQFETQEYECYALAMIIETGSEYTLKSNINNKQEFHSHPPALQFIRWLLSDNRSLKIASLSKCWLWNKKE